ncbi:MAG: hypothetical protein LBE32_08920 [Burkholderiales bacterium]|jgi:hypothetical protein|nr:hypothetical protein [Burkholderiales bacterium]
MDTKRLSLASLAALMALLIMSCGGGGDSAQPKPPAPIDPPLGSIDLPRGPKLELLTGKISADFDNCQSANGAMDEAQFSHLLRATVYKDAVYLAETGENCANVGLDINLSPRNLLPAIRKLSGGTVETALVFYPYSTFGYDPVTVRYPSGFHRKESTGESFVLGYAAASSEWNFALNENEVSLYTERGGWSRYVPGLFRFRPSQSWASYDDLVAGAGIGGGLGAGEPPSHADGKGFEARFTAPHDLEADAAGRFYLIDDGRIRTIDSDYEVATLDHAALGIADMGKVKALDADHQGNIHVLEQRIGGYKRYTWHRLADGSQADFQIPGAEFGATLPTLETFAVTGNDIVLAVRHPFSLTQLYRVSATGEVVELTGTDTPTDQPSQYLLPPVKHIEYGVDGHLYIVLPQGVLIARDYSVQ